MKTLEYNLEITKHLRQILKKPLGLLIEGDPEETVKVAKKYIEELKPPLIVTVGDIVSRNLLEANIKLIPNPSNGSFKIDFGVLTYDDIIVEIYNVSGKLLYKDNVSENVYEVDMTSHSKGIYFVKFSVDGMIHNEKLIIK